MITEDIRKKLYDQLRQDYNDLELIWLDIREISTGVPTFFVTLADMFTRVYTLIKLGDEECFMSCRIDEYEEELAI
jgi:hypothetical protein